jgi:hypothetical protein
MANPVQVVLGLLMVFFIPGYCLVNALFPRRNEFDPEIDIVYRITLGIGLSMALTILVSFGLNALGVNPKTGLGYVDAPYIWASLLSLSGILFAIGWWRGGYPWMAKVHPKLARAPPRDPRTLDMRTRTPEKQMRLEALGKKRAAAMKRVKEYESKERMHAGSRKEHYRELKRKTVEEIEAFDKEIEELTAGEGLEG